jgi:hypothetical protein
MLRASLCNPQQNSAPWKGGKEGTRRRKRHEIVRRFMHQASEPVIKAPAALSGEEGRGTGAGRAGHVPNYGGMLVLRFVFAIEGRNGAEELVSDVGEEGGTARRDAILRDEQEKAGEEIIDVGSGVELAESGGEGVG